MQGDIFGNPEVPGSRPFVNQNPKMLKATLGPYQELLAKQGSMVAYQGQVDFDYELQSLGQAMRLILSGERLALMRCSGQGELFLADLARDIHVLELEGDGIAVDGANLLAMDSGLAWDVVRVQGAVGVPGAGKAQININGRGPVAILTSGHPLVLRVTPGSYTFCDADAVIAWSTALRVSTQAAVTASSAMSLRADSGEGWQMQFQGEGWVVVQPAELASPPALAPGPAGQGWQSQDPRNFRGGGFQ
jgi:uncharacterized protein (AIM24 family)